MHAYGPAISTSPSPLIDYDEPWRGQHVAAGVLMPHGDSLAGSRYAPRRVRLRSGNKPQLASQVGQPTL